MQISLHRLAMNVVVILLLPHTVAIFGQESKAPSSALDVYNTYLQRALSEEAKRDFKAAIADFNNAIEVMPDYSEAYRLRADAEKAIGDLSGALQDEANLAYVAIGWKVSLPLTVPDLTSCPPQPSERGTPYRAYPGCEVPRNQSATLNLVGIRAKFVDERGFFNIPSHGRGEKEQYLENSTSLELLPGRHSIVFILPKPGGCGLVFLSRCPPDVEVLYPNVLVDAGKTYTAIGTGLTSGDWLSIIADTGYKMPTSPSPKDESGFVARQVQISEEQPDPAAYLQIYETYIKSGDPENAYSTLDLSLALFPKNPERKTVEEMAAKLRRSLQKAQVDTILAEVRNNQKQRPVEPSNTSKILSCEPPQSTQPQMPTSDAALLAPDDAADGEAPPTLDTVLSRARRYVATYEAKLGNLIGEEVYVQDAEWTSPVPHAKQQQTESDFAIRQVGDSWIGLRDVNCVDGNPVKRKTQDFQKLFEDASQADIQKAVDVISSESAGYNIGEFQRTTNEPTFALQVLYPDNKKRFDFRKADETSIGDIPRWIVSFREIQGPALVHDSNGLDEFATGTLWIEAETGRILKTEMNVPHQAFPSFRARTMVSYENDPRLGMLVPASMQEHYDTDYGHTLDCKADYFNFRRFQVEVRFDFDAPPSLRPPPN